MQVAIITAWYPSERNPLYGIFIQNQVKALASHCSVYVMLLKWSLVPYTKERKEGDLTIIERGSFYFPNMSEPLLNFWANSYVRFFKTRHQKYTFDLVHCHDHYGAFVGDKIKNQLSIPYICTIHNSNIMNDKLVGWKQAYLPRILNNADKVISVGEKLAHTLESKFVSKKVTVIPNYIDTDLFRIESKKKDRDFSFLFVGGLESHKGVLELVKAFHKANLEDTSLHLVGNGILEQDIKQYIDSEKLGGKVILHGEVPNEEVPLFYNSSHVYVSVSEYETFGVTVLEAMSCGLPILYTDSGGPNELVEDFAGLKINNRTVESIANGLQEIKEKYSDFDADQIRNHVVENYGSQKIVNELLHEYKSVLNAKA